MKEIILSNGAVALVDDHWYPILSKWSWHETCKGYAERSIRPGYGIMMHRVVAMTPTGLETDHVNNNKLDNREANLRVCNSAENARSRLRKVGVSGYRGVTPTANGKWEASIMVNYKRRSLGVFDDPVDGAKAYDKAARDAHRHFATLNFADE